MSAKRNEEGVTLLEVLLVLTIAMSIFVLSLRLYSNYRREADIISLKNNIDVLFQAAATYYEVNCPKGGDLDPAIATDDVIPIDITADLKDMGYLPLNFPVVNPLVDDTDGAGYVVQFNKYMTPRMQNVCSNPPTCDATPDSIQIGTTVVWKIQVAVLMKNTDPVQLENDKNFLLADCLSTVTGDVSALCSTNPTGNYMVFERLPSQAIANLNAQTTFWQVNPRIKQFKQMYTTNPITDLTNQSHTTEYQYYYCSS